MDGHRLLLEKTIYLPLMVNVIVSAKTASRVRCIFWFLANIQVRVRVYHHGLIGAALAGWARRTIYLVMGDRGFRTADIVVWCDITRSGTFVCASNRFMIISR